jgi:hypothetical protein
LKPIFFTSVLKRIPTEVKWKILINKPHIKSERRQKDWYNADEEKLTKEEWAAAKTGRRTKKRKVEEKKTSKREEVNLADEDDSENDE